MARLPYAEDTEAVDAEIRRRRGGGLRPLDKMLLHSPPVASGWNTYLGKIREDSTLPGSIRELAILRVAVLNDCAYEWNAHEPVALKEGLAPRSVAALRSDDPSRDLSARESVTCRFTDAVTLDVRVPDELFDEIKRHFDNREVVELTATIATYNMVSRFLEALRIGHETNDRERAPQS